MVFIIWLRVYNEPRSSDSSRFSEPSMVLGMVFCKKYSTGSDDFLRSIIGEEASCLPVPEIK